MQGVSERTRMLHNSSNRNRSGDFSGQCYARGQTGSLEWFLLPLEPVTPHRDATGGPEVSRMLHNLSIQIYLPESFQPDIATMPWGERSREVTNCCPPC